MRIRIFVGTGGVGKTSVAAASALRTALGGGKCLVLTIDPARRLRTAIGISGEGFQQRVALPDSARGELWASQLDVAASLNRAVSEAADSKQAEVIFNHSIYRVLLQSLAGMQELMAVERVDQALDDGFENIFIDTAPSRHALEFVDKPEAFAQLVSFPLVRLVGRTYQWWEGSALGSLSKKSFELYGKVEQMLGSTLTRQILEFFSIFRIIAEAYGKRARRTLALLRNTKVTSFTIVTTPFKAQRDAGYFTTELGKRRFSVGTLVMNRVWPELPAVAEPGEPLASVLDWYQDTSSAHEEMWRKIRADFNSKIPRLVRLPELAGNIDGLAALHKMAESAEL